MNWHLQIALTVFIFTMLLSWSFGRLALPIAFRLRLVDRPGNRKTHSRPVAYLGGVALFSAAAASAGLLMVLAEHLGMDGFVPPMAACLAPALGAMLLGLWDDAFQLMPRPKFFFQALLALGFCFFGYRLHTLHLPGFPPVQLGITVSVGLSTFFILAVVNGANMVDGSDGLCTVSSAAALLVLGLAARNQGQPELWLLAIAGAGACCGFLYWNRPPARIYLGDAGSLGLGFLLPCVALALGSGQPGQFLEQTPEGLPWQPFNYQAVLLVLLMGLPALEVTLTVLRRALQGRSLGRGDQGHLHNRLRRMGVKPGKIALWAAGYSLLSGGIALALLGGHKGLATLLILGLVVLLSFGLQYLGYAQFIQRRWLDERRPHYAVAKHFAAMQAAKLLLANDTNQALVLIIQACQELGVQEIRISVQHGTQQQRWHWDWRLLQDPVAPGAADRLRLPREKCHASWILDNDLGEPELAMDRRVITAEFMRTALTRLCELRKDTKAIARLNPKELPRGAKSYIIGAQAKRKGPQVGMDDSNAL